MAAKQKQRSVGVLVVVHITNMPIEAVLALYLVGTHWARKLWFDPTLVTLMLY